MGVIRNIIQHNRFRKEELASFRARLFFEGPNQRTDLERFGILLFLSVWSFFQLSGSKHLRYRL